MHFISVAEAAKKLGKTTRRVQQMITEKRIPGVMRIGVRTYAIPHDFTVVDAPTDQKASNSLALDGTPEEAVE